MPLIASVCRKESSLPWGLASLGAAAYMAKHAVRGIIRLYMIWQQDCARGLRVQKHCYMDT